MPNAVAIVGDYIHARTYAIYYTNTQIHINVEPDFAIKLLFKLCGMVSQSFHLFLMNS
jgi:hypothetical protein